MANLRGRPNARSRRKIKGRRRKLNIAALVYKFLSLGGRPGDPRTPPAYDQDTAHSPKRRKELRHSLNSQVAGTRNMVNKRKESNKNSKAHRIKRGYTDRDAAKSSCMCKRGGEGIDRMKMYIQKALDFGVESGYLIPKDTAYKVLRVSSDLVSDGNYVRDGRNSDRAVSRDRDRSPHRTQIKLDDYGVQEPCKSRRSHRRRRSGSGSRRRRSSRRRKRRRRSRSANREEVVEDDDYKSDNQPEKRSSTENVDRKEGNDRSNQSDEEKTTKGIEDGSDLSMDEDETDEDEKKEDDTNKS